RSRAARRGTGAATDGQGHRVACRRPRPPGLAQLHAAADHETAIAGMADRVFGTLPGSHGRGPAAQRRTGGDRVSELVGPCRTRGRLAVGTIGERGGLVRGAARILDDVAAAADVGESERIADHRAVVNGVALPYCG